MRCRGGRSRGRRGRLTCRGLLRKRNEDDDGENDCYERHCQRTGAIGHLLVGAGRPGWRRRWGSALGCHAPSITDLSGSVLHSRPRGELSSSPLGVASPQSLHDERVVGERVGGVDEPPERRVVRGRRASEAFPDRLLFRGRIQPPLTLDIEYESFPLREFHRVRQCQPRARKASISAGVQPLCNAVVIFFISSSAARNNDSGMPAVSPLDRR